MQLSNVELTTETGSRAGCLNDPAESVSGANQPFAAMKIDSPKPVR
jgi:hypothetical protein